MPRAFSRSCADGSTTEDVAVAPTIDAGPTPTLASSGFLHGQGLGGALATPNWVNHRLESRMRENRTYGSEGGGPEEMRDSLPLFNNGGLESSGRLTERR